MKKGKFFSFLLKRNGFTLLEILISTIILAIVSLGAFRAFQTFSNTQVRTQDRRVAMNTISSSFEEIRRDVESGAVSFSSLNDESSTGWKPLDEIPQYTQPDAFFERRITYNENTPQTGITQIVIDMQWPDQNGVMQQARNVFSLSAPSEFRYGNIFGTVYHCGDPDNQPELENVSVKVEESPDGFEWIQGTAVQTDNLGRYTFRTPQGKVLPIGNGYRLKATRAGLRDSIEPPADAAINLPDSPDIELNICMYDATAQISGRLVIKDTSQGIGGRTVSLYRVSNRRKSIYTDDAGSFSFQLEQSELPANPQEQRCFSVATGYNNTASNRKRFPYYHALSGQGFRGDFCGQFYHRGWSSSQISIDLPDGNSCQPDNPWFGKSTTEAMDNPFRSACVKAGQSVNLGDIPLVPLPNPAILTINLTTPPNIIMTDSNFPQIAIQWLGSEYAVLTRTTTYAITGTPPNFTVQVPVPNLHRFLPASSEWVLQVQARAKQPDTALVCCGYEGEEKTIETGWENVIINADSVTHNMTIASCPCEDAKCGDAYGIITDLITGAPIPGSQVTLSGYSPLVATNGSWHFKCCPTCPDSEVGFLKQGDYTITLQATNYYTRCSCPAASFPHKGDGDASSGFTPKMSVFQYSDSEGNFIKNFTRVATGNPQGYVMGLYPMGKGDIEVTVVEISGNKILGVISGASVRLTTYKGSTTHTTNASGIANFTGIMESWPPNDNFGSIEPEWVQDHLIDETRKHTIRATATKYSKQKSTTVNDIRLDDGENKQITIEIDFEQPGGID